MRLGDRKGLRGRPRQRGRLRKTAPGDQQVAPSCIRQPDELLRLS
jgi:hypothetical protein